MYVCMYVDTSLFMYVSEHMCADMYVRMHVCVCRDVIILVRMHG